MKRINMKRKFTTLVCYSLLFSPHATAIPVDFDLRSSLIESIDEQENISLVNEGLVATLTASTGVLNGTSSSFGINATGAGDATSLIDDDSGIAEFIQIQFNLAINFVSLSVSSFGSTDAGLLSVNNIPLIEINSSGLNSTGELFIDNGDLLTLAFVSGNGFSFDSFTVMPVSVNEPDGVILFFLAGVILMFGQKIRKRQIIPIHF